MHTCIEHQFEDLNLTAYGDILDFKVIFLRITRILCDRRGATKIKHESIYYNCTVYV